MYQYFFWGKLKLMFSFEQNSFISMFVNDTKIGGLNLYYDLFKCYKGELNVF